MTYAIVFKLICQIQRFYFALTLWFLHGYVCLVLIGYISGYLRFDLIDLGVFKYQHTINVKTIILIRLVKLLQHLRLSTI